MRRRAVKRWCFLGVALLTFMTQAPLWAEGPALEFDTEGHLILHSLPPVLDEDEVRPHLTRGLTTTFLFRVNPKNLRLKKKQQGAARIEIRYELWDEVFHVATAAMDGKIERRTLDSFGELESWWEGLRLAVTGDLFQRLRGSTKGNSATTGEARVSLDVIPFSQDEQRDTQRWFSETLDDAGRSAAEDIAESADQSTDTLDRTFHLLMATSIERQALASFHWNVPIEQVSMAGGR